MFGAPNATDRMLGSVVGPAVDMRHDGDTCLEAGEAERKFGKDQQGDTEDHQRVPCCWVSAVVQFDHSEGFAITSAIPVPMTTTFRTR